MRSPMLRAALGATLALVAGAAPAAASTWTVDDDGVQCPNASFSSIQAAIDQLRRTTRSSSAPAPTASVRSRRTAPTPPLRSVSRNGLTIQKPITLRGAGADEVFIEPEPSLGSSLAGTAPFLRDGGGNVITIARQSLAPPTTTNSRADISGVTIRSPHAYAEAGVAYFNTSGTLKDVVVGPIARADADSATPARMAGASCRRTRSRRGPGSGTVRREVHVIDSLIEGYQAGGILFDGGRGADGTPENLARRASPSTATSAAPRWSATARAVDRPGGHPLRGRTRGSVTEARSPTMAGSPRAPSRTPTASSCSMRRPATIRMLPGARALTISGTTFQGNRYALFKRRGGRHHGAPRAPVSTTGNWFGCAAGPVVGGPSNTTHQQCGLRLPGISGLDAGRAPPRRASTRHDPLDGAACGPRPGHADRQRADGLVP